MARARTFRLTIEGSARLEDVPVREIATLLDDLVGLVARGSAEVLRRPINTTGRYRTAIEQASHVRLSAITSSSVVVDFFAAPPTPLPDGIDLDAESLSEMGISLVLDVADGKGLGEHPTLARSVGAFYDRVRSRRPDAIIKLEDRRNGHRRVAVLDERTRSLIEETLPTVAEVHQPSEVTGRLYEANVESRTAQVRSPTGERIDVQFEREHEADVRRLLGNRAELRGDVSYDPATNRARRIRVTEVPKPRQLDLEFEGVDFWVDPTIPALVTDAGAVPTADPSSLELREAADADWDALYEALSVGE